ncbi:Deoxyguanosinetriphosphate triphosphohydrolase-like protein [Corynebacterium provencense]|uniref:Deoxyguanosinetriphosphate triphosphohydrolase-like protein n=1 Tax=Corynebacterium provencense TaxID=1737425 RepID=A0A2Z3YV96_9CORY|nr:deoxyguanosinetriphosphate triphosphohydrolase [Corynebacterium provencense]AWT26524.1 Deoxyguanosinetriphosphate triphosphohydrolase-like protein [Corynebacterium provencense]
MERYAYTAHDLERFLPTPPKHLGVAGALPDGREDFDRDRARVLHSAALRRLADKTQVVGPGEGDTPRTRLTHSLEVGQISRGIGTALGLDPDLCELAGLTHDIGHPPYGHNGEAALNTLAAGCGGFEGNAQTLRILVRLEPKVLDAGGRSRGLNLTRASLDAAAKYPWGPVDADGRHRRKYSCYAEDADVFDWVRDGAPEGRRSMEAQVMDWADDVAYSVHDVEDGILSGRISLGVLWDLVELANIADKGAAAFGGDPAELLEAADRLRGMDLVSRAADFHGGLPDLVALKALTSELVSRYVTAAVTATRAAYPGTAGLGRYSADLVLPPQVVAEVTLLKSVAVLYVMDERRHLANQDRQRDRIYRVTSYLAAGAPGSLDLLFRNWWLEAEGTAGKLRVIIDQVASLTESRLERIDRAASADSAAWG